jgi:glycopeptide antibiotics resistance protein
VIHRLRGALLAVYVGYLAVVAVLVLDPSQQAPGASLSLVARVLQAAQVPVPANSSVLEVLSNVALFVPFSLLGMLIWPARRALAWVGAGAVLSVAIELCQLLVLPQRFATISDVVANTLGSLVGAVLATVITRWLARSPRPRLRPESRADRR